MLRGHHFSERCSRCDDQADGHCPRCAEIFCAAHLPVEPRRCDDCEAEYAERLAALDDTGGSMISPLLVAATVIGAAFAAATGFFAAAWAVVGLGTFSSLVIVLGERSDRRNPRLRASRDEVRELREAFLAERTRLIAN